MESASIYARMTACLNERLAKISKTVYRYKGNSLSTTILCETTRAEMMGKALRKIELNSRTAMRFRCKLSQEPHLVDVVPSYTSCSFSFFLFFSLIFPFLFLFLLFFSFFFLFLIFVFYFFCSAFSFAWSRIIRFHFL